MQRIDHFLSSVQRPDLVAYFGEFGPDPLMGLEARMVWAKKWQFHPDIAAEAGFLVRNERSLRELMMRQTAGGHCRGGFKGGMVPMAQPAPRNDTANFECLPSVDEFDDDEEPTVLMSVGQRQALAKKVEEKRQRILQQRKLAHAQASSTQRLVAPSHPGNRMPVLMTVVPVAVLSLIAGMLLPRMLAPSDFDDVAAAESAEMAVESALR